MTERERKQSTDQGKLQLHLQTVSGGDTDVSFSLSG